MGRGGRKGREGRGVREGRREDGRGGEGYGPRAPYGLLSSFGPSLSFCYNDAFGYHSFASHPVPLNFPHRDGMKIGSSTDMGRLYILLKFLGP